MDRAIVYLLDSADIYYFKISLESLNLINFSRPTPILVFHEASLSKDFIEECRFICGLQFIELEFNLSDYPPKILNAIPELFIGPNGVEFPMGYRHMCRFFSGELFKRTELKPYRYILRMDADSAILESIEDPFERMINEQAAYGYRMIAWDDPSCYVNFYETFQMACESLGRDVHLEKNGKVYYSNFEVMDLDCFRADEYSKVYECLDGTGGFFIYRWGDHILRFNYLSTFDKKVIKFNFDYCHAKTVYKRDDSP